MGTICSIAERIFTDLTCELVGADLVCLAIGSPVGCVDAVPVGLGIERRLGGFPSVVMLGFGVFFLGVPLSCLIPERVFSTMVGALFRFLPVLEFPFALALDFDIMHIVWNLPINPILSGERFTYSYRMGGTYMAFQIFSVNSTNKVIVGSFSGRNFVGVFRYAAKESA